MDPDTGVVAEDVQDAPEVELADEVLVEEVSIDGMCGVY
jgi:mycofactocin precursor